MKINCINCIVSAICLAYFTTAFPISKSSDVDTISVLSVEPVYTINNITPNKNINNEVNAEDIDITFKKKRSHRKVFAKGPKGMFKKVLSKDPHRIAAIKEEINNIDGEEISDTEDEAILLNRREAKKYRLKASKKYRLKNSKKPQN